MKKALAIIFFSLICLCILTGLKVDVDELKGAKKIDFVNYNGPHRTYDTARSIRLIGELLVNADKQGDAFRYHMKYSIIHAVDDTSNDKLNADIFSIDRDAEVDHIRNVRLIISGYLSYKYGYSTRDADTLAVFISYYNALYRGNMEYFSSKYKPVVTKYINEKNAGISTKYYEWPGRTKMLIPLTLNAKKGDIRSLNTEEISDEKVIEELKKQKDKGIDERKDMVVIKEKEIEKDKKEIEAEKKQVEKEKDILTKEKEIIDKNKEEIKKEEEKITKEKEEAKLIKDDKERAKKEEEIKKEEKKLEEKKRDVIKKDEAVKKKEDVVNKKEEVVTKKQENVIKKEEAVKNEKQNIKKDETKIKEEKKKEEIKKSPEEVKKELETKEKELAKKEEELKNKESELKTTQPDKTILYDKFYYLKTKEYMENGHYNNELYAIDAKTRKLLVKSPLKEICGKRYDVFSEGVVVITYKNTHDANHYLALLDLDKLEVKSIGKENIFFRSFVEVRENFIYAIIKEGEDYYLGKFNPNLELIAKSTETVDNSTFITFYKEYIYINNAKKDIVVLNKDNLKLIDTIMP
jgi:hypothetical protein